MTVASAQTPMDVFAGLWPAVFDKLNDEELASWERVTSRIEPAIAIKLLRKMHEEMVGYPKPGHFVAAIRTWKEKHQKRTGRTSNTDERAGLSWIQWEREELVRSSYGDLQAAIKRAPDDVINVALLYWQWAQTYDKVGATSRSCIARYWQWQHADDPDCPFKSWTEESAKEYASRSPVPNVHSLQHILKDILLNGVMP